MVKNNYIKTFLSLIGLVFFLVIAVATDDTESTPVPDLNCSVRFDGSQFTIQNNDTYNWTDCRIYVNDDFELNGKSFIAGQTYTVGCMQFTKDNGERFNPYTHKVQNIFFYCTNANGDRASYYGSW